MIDLVSKFVKGKQYSLGKYVGVYHNMLFFNSGQEIDGEFLANRVFIHNRKELEHILNEYANPTYNKMDEMIYLQKKIDEQFLLLDLFIQKNTDMNDQEKYYTPSIEEFHVGFEYEFQLCVEWNNEKDDFEDEGEWVKRIYNGGVILLEETLREYDVYKEGKRTFLDAIDYYKESGWIRVKYLDKEDIESLGWGDLNKWVVFKGRGTFMLTSFTPFECPFERVITISTKDFIRDKSGRFEIREVVSRINIKNKSQLKQLMEWLKIVPKQI